MESHAEATQGPLNGHATPPGGLGSPWTVVSWIAIIVISTAWICQDWLISGIVGEPQQGQALAEEDPDSSGLMVGLQDEILGKVIVGFAEIFPANGVMVMEMNAAELREGTGPQQLAWVILRARVVDVDAGIEAFKDLDVDAFEASAEEALYLDVESALEAAAGDRQLDEATRERLRGSLGYFGRMAISLSEPIVAKALGVDARRAAVALMLLLVIFGVVGFCGLIALIIMIVFACTHRVHGKVSAHPGHGVYIETFAIWLFVFFGLQILAGLSGIEPALLMATLAFFLSLVVLAWPVIRGRSWRMVRQEIGLSGSGGVPGVEPLFGGLATWSMALPLMGVGLLMTIVLSFLVEIMTGNAPQPSHPIQQEAMKEGWIQVLLLYLVAAVAAPVVEETMFRGVLYTHLRGATSRFGTWLSVAASILVSSVIFAAIHPQGLVFMPPLMGLAAGFCIGREWRGSLAAPMVAHGVHNALVVTLNVILFM